MGGRVHFGELVSRWAVAVARRLVVQMGGCAQRCWIGRDQAIYLAYLHGDQAMGIRIDDLVTDRLTEACLATFAPGSDLATAEAQAANYYDELWSGGAPPEWVDDEGRAWWGDRCHDWGADEWRTAVGAEPAVVIDVR